MSKGILFHSLGAHVENALSPYVLVLDFCWKRSSREFERSVLEWFWHWSNSTKYRGSIPFRALKTNKSNLNTTELNAYNQTYEHQMQNELPCSVAAEVSSVDNWVIHKNESFCKFWRDENNFSFMFVQLKIIAIHSTTNITNTVFNPVSFWSRMHHLF